MKIIAWLFMTCVRKSFLFLRSQTYPGVNSPFWGDWFLNVSQLVQCLNLFSRDFRHQEPAEDLTNNPVPVLFHDCSGTLRSSR